MGLPKKHRKKYSSHKQRWDKNSIVEEEVLVKDYCLKNKKEIRKIEFKLSKFKKVAKSLNMTIQTKESQEAKHFIEKLKMAGFLDLEANSLDAILDITLRDILERRLSNLIYKKKLSRTPGQARQFIVHGHVRVGGKTVNSPSYLVTLKDEETIEFRDNSTLTNENHPERVLAAGGMIEIEEMEKVPLNDGKSESFDEKEAKLDDEEQDEVKE